MAEEKTRFDLAQSDIPKAWYNILPVLPTPLPPPLHPGTMKPAGPDDLSPIFPMSLIEQEMCPDKTVPIPEEVREIYRIWRPTPFRRAVRLEKALKTPAKIYFKDESVSPAGSHKPNTAVAQAYFNKQAGIKRIATETGAGQWGSALSFACKLFDIECQVYMVKCSFEQKPYRRLMMETWGGKVNPSPSPATEFGRKILLQDPKCPGSLGIAISEALEDTVTHPGTKYALGSVLNHVLLHQTIVGLETAKQMEMAKIEPDVMIGCVGGGSNFAGFIIPFVEQKLKGKNIKFLGVEPAACPTLTKGPYRYDFGDTAMMTPLLKMHTLGSSFVPAGIHAGGLRYHGDAPILSALVDAKLVEAVAYTQKPVFEAAVLFARTEGFLPAPETSHAIRAAVDEAIKCRETGEKKTIVFNYSGHGHFDLAAYEKYLTNQLEDYEHPDEEIEKALGHLPLVGEE